MVRYYLRSRCDCPACLNDVKSSLPKGFAIGVIVAGALSTIVTLIDVFGVNKYAVDFNGYGVSIGFGLILALIASIAIVVTGLLAMSGGKITKEHSKNLLNLVKDLPKQLDGDNFYCKNCCK